jgi:outer membrane usher protein FimD/PapC
VEAGSKLTVAWFALDTGGAAPPNYRIDEVSFDVGMIDNHVDASLSHPDNGWPAGNYQVQLIVNGEVIEAMDFSAE